MSYKVLKSEVQELDLVYCRGFYETDHFLLMSILKPDAHAQAYNNSIMGKLAIMAAKFQAQF